MLLLAALLSCGAHPTYKLVPIASPARVERQGGAYRAQATLRFRIVPVIVPPRSSDRAFHDHVLGHQVIAQRVAQSSNGSVSAMGKTERDARAQLRKTLAEMASDLQKELLREERVYDSVTEDGRAQDQGPMFGLPGGQNGHGLCP